MTLSSRCAMAHVTWTDSRYRARTCWRAPHRRAADVRRETSRRRPAAGSCVGATIEVAALGVVLLCRDGRCRLHRNGSEYHWSQCLPALHLLPHRYVLRLGLLPESGLTHVKLRQPIGAKSHTFAKPTDPRTYLWRQPCTTLSLTYIYSGARHQGSQAREAEALPCRRQISTSTTCGSHH